MKKVSFVRENGFQSSGNNLSNVALRHQASKMHITNHIAYNILGNVDVACALDEAKQREISQHNDTATRYGRMLEHHIDTTVFLAAQGLAFRGHDESKLSANRGNFVELIDLLGGYSQELRSFLDRERITYTSHEPQNDLIECIYDEVRQEIQRRVDDSPFLAVMMDDTSDTTNIEQSAVSIRLVHNGDIEEHLLRMVDSSGDQSANALTDILLETLKSFKVTPESSGEKLIGQSYDGAPSMSGQLNGVQKQVQEVFKYAYYNHCVAHRLSLCASQTAKKIPRIAKFFDGVDKLITFFRSSPKRTHRLGHSLPKPGDTRWLSRDTALALLDKWYEEIGAVLYSIAEDPREKAETQATARGLCVQIQHVQFVFLLKFYRKLFEYCTPIITVMQKPTLDAVQLSSMLTDFQKILGDFRYDQIWEDTIKVDPEIPTVRNRGGWRGIENGNDGSPESWKLCLISLAATCAAKFSEQINWRFENLGKFKWMDLIHPAKFEERRKASIHAQRALIAETAKVYSFAVADAVSLEHCLNVLYQNKEISALLQKIVRERDVLVAKKKEKRLRMAARRNEELAAEEANEERATVEANDHFIIESENLNIDEECIKEGKPSIQDLLTVVQKTNLEEAIPQAITLLQLAAVTPLTSVHCERVFSRMKRIVSPARSTMLQSRKEMLVFLQVEHKTLRWLSKQPNFKVSVIARFKSYNQRRLQRFTQK